MSKHTAWRSPAGERNAQALREQYADGFLALSEYDRIGHLLLYRAGKKSPATRYEEIVGVAVLRRAVMLFTGVRTLLEASLPDVAKAPARAYFEVWLNYRCLAYGGERQISLELPTAPEAREPRARRYYVAAERRALRARAVALSPTSKYPPPTIAHKHAIEAELTSEIARLKDRYPEEWAYFGDVTEASVRAYVGGRNERQWFEAEFANGDVKSVAKLADAFDYGWEYDVLYDAFSALVHSRGIGHDITLGQDEMSVHLPHDPAWFELIAFVVTGWHLMLLMTAAKWHAPEMIVQLQQLHTRHRVALETLTPQTFPNLLG